jgi:hypothetical protein
LSLSLSPSPRFCFGEFSFFRYSFSPSPCLCVEKEKRFCVWGNASKRWLSITCCSYLDNHRRLTITIFTVSFFGVFSFLQISRFCLPFLVVSFCFSLLLFKIDNTRRGGVCESGHKAMKDSFSFFYIYIIFLFLYSCPVLIKLCLFLCAMCLQILSPM